MRMKKSRESDNYSRDHSKKSLTGSIRRSTMDEIKQERQKLRSNSRLSESRREKENLGKELNECKKEKAYLRQELDKLGKKYDKRES
mmetsp:Transcript_1804/g.1730  ORF Transcript_1804/g.1730 Transcript_1804/m.1730 type:complete len:87 (-) Transcript_1804:562-822(-)